MNQTLPALRSVHYESCLLRSEQFCQGSASRMAAGLCTEQVPSSRNSTCNSSPDASHQARRPASSQSPLRILTLNVHGWHNEERQSWDLLLSTLIAASPDIIALQEATAHRIPPLAKALDNMNWTVCHNCAILTRFKLSPRQAHQVSGTGIQRESRTKKNNASGKKTGCQATKAKDVCQFDRFCVATVTVPNGLDVSVFCVHLDHRSETRRLSQMHSLCAQYPMLCDAGTANMLLGDFNALTASDFTYEAWEKVSQHRLLNNWEAPVCEVTFTLTGPTSYQRPGSQAMFPRRLKQGKQTKIPVMAFHDCWSRALKCEGPVGTSRFATRIDYIYLSPKMAEWVALLSCKHIETIRANISDHNAVLATLNLKDSNA